MSAAPPTFSVIIPTRNRPDTLARCLENLAPSAQSLDATSYEVIVSDDGDGDDCRALLARDFPWARYVSGPQRGPAANRNCGAQAAVGEWFVFTDDDTRPDPHWLRAIAEARTGVSVVEGRTVCREGLHSPREHAPVNDAGGNWWSCNLAVRRETFRALRGFDERFRFPHMEDVDFRERALRANTAWHFAPDAVVDHPARRDPWGTGWRRAHEAEVLFAVLHRQPFSIWRCTFNVARARWRTIGRAPCSRDAASAALSWMVETVDILLQWRGWWRAAR